MGQLRGVPVLTYHSGASYAVATLPTGIVVGDLLVAAIGDRYLPSLPAGWTTVTFGSGNNQSGRLGWKIADASDVSNGTLTYILGGAGEGHAGLFAYVKGTFNTVGPVDRYETYLSQPMGNALPYVPVTTGQTLHHFANLRADAPAVALSTRGVRLAHVESAGASAAAYGEEATSETTLNTVWDSPTTVNGSFLVEFTVSQASGTTVWPGWTTTAFPLTASYSAVPVSPSPDQYQLTLRPTLIALADGTPSPFQVQFQTSSDPAFGTLSWSQTMIGRTKGLTTVTVGNNLPDGATSYWRVRAGDGTTWGPWSAASRLLIYTARAAANEYVYLNAGALDGTTSHHGVEYVFQNVGILATPVPHAVEYITENVGFIRTGKQDGVEYIYEGDVSTNIPIPHLWFVWRNYGFVEDHVFVYGQGLGTLQAQYHGKLLIDWGPDFSLADVQAAVFDWSVQPAGPNGYNLLRHIDAGNAITMPVTNVETDIIEIIVPVATAPPFGSGAQNDLVYANTDGGLSNTVPFLLYPTVPVHMGLPITNVRSANKLRMSPMPVDVTAIEELHRGITTTPYLIVDGKPQRMPMLAARTATLSSVGTWSVTADLQSALSVAMGADWRWLADPAKLVARPDLGTGILEWRTSQGGTDRTWLMDALTAGYIDPAYLVPSRNGAIAKPAFVLPGKKWMSTSGVLSTGSGWTVAIAAVLHAANNPVGQIFTSFVTGGQPVGTYPVELVIASDVLTVKVGGRLVTQRTTHLNGRATIVVMGLDDDGTGKFLIVDEAGLIVNFSHPAMAPAASQKLHLARPGTIVVQDQTATLDVLDLSLFARMLTTDEMWSAANKLDSIYGVSR